MHMRVSCVLAMLVMSACSAGQATNASEPLSSPRSTLEVHLPNGRKTTRTDAESSSTTNAPSRCSQPTGRQRVTMWVQFSGEAAPNSFKALVDQFAASHPSIQLEVAYIDGPVLDRLRHTTVDAWPDIALLTPQALRQFMDSGALIPPPECHGSSGAELLPVVRAAYSVNGVLQAEPFGVSTPVLFFDSNEMRAAGLDPTDPPITLAALSAASRQIVSSGASPHGLVVYDWFANFLIHQGAAKRGELIGTPDNGRKGEPFTVHYESPSNVADMTWLHDVVAHDGAVWTGGIPGGIEDLVRIVDRVDGGTMTIHTCAALGDVISLLDAGSFPGVEIGVGPMPGDAPGGAVGGTGLFEFDHGDAQRAGAAAQVVQWFTQPSSVAQYAAATGAVPSSRAAADQPSVRAAWNLHPILEVAYQQLASEVGSVVTAGPLYGPEGIVMSLMNSMTSEVVVDGRDPADALAGLTTSVNAVLREYQSSIP